MTTYKKGNSTARLRSLFAASLLTASYAWSAPAPLLHPMFQDHAVLQRDRSIPVWGTAGANETVTLKFASNSTTAKADSEGHWLATLPAMPAGGPYTLEAQSSA